MNPAKLNAKAIQRRRVIKRYHPAIAGWESMQAKRSPPLKATRVSYKGRKCKFSRCKHILSIYNHELYCHIHLVQMTADEKYKLEKSS